MDKKNKSAIFLNIIVALIIALGFTFTRNYSLKSITLNPEEKLEKFLEGEEYIKAFEDEEFQLYYSGENEDIKPYAFIKKFGLWLFEYPNIRNIQRYSKGKDNIYYYGEFALDPRYDFVENNKGEKIYARKIKLTDKEVNLFEIPYKNEDISYRFGDDLALMTEENLFLQGELGIYKNKDNSDIDILRTIGETRENEPYLWELIEESIQGADKSEKIPDGRKYSYESGEEIFQEIIYVSYDKGHYINVGKNKSAFIWTHSMSYDIDFAGQHADTIGINEEDYFDFDYSLDNFNGPSVYRVEIPEELRSYMDKL